MHCSGLTGAAVSTMCQLHAIALPHLRRRQFTKRLVYIGVSAIEPIRHAADRAQASEREPTFDIERVIWDAHYRRVVIESLRQWRLRRDRQATGAAPSKEAA